QVEARLDDAVVTEADAHAGVGAEQAAPADGDDLGAAPGQRPHDRGAATDVAAVPDDDAGRDPALDHRGAERAGVVVDEALVHDRRPGRQVGPETDAVGVGHTDTRRDDVVDQARELVDPVHGDRSAARGAQAGPGGLEPGD